MTILEWVFIISALFTLSCGLAGLLHQAITWKLKRDYQRLELESLRRANEFWANHPAPKKLSAADYNGFGEAADAFLDYLPKFVEAINARSDGNLSIQIPMPPEVPKRPK